MAVVYTSERNAQYNRKVLRFGGAWRNGVSCTGKDKENSQRRWQGKKEFRMRVFISLLWGLQCKSCFIGDAKNL